MGRHLESNDVSDGAGFEEFDPHPGCMWGMLHILVAPKRLPLRRKHGRGKHAMCCRTPKTVSFDHYTKEVQEYLDAESVPLLEEQQTRKTSSTNVITRKAHLKALVAKEIFARTWLQKTDTVHLEPSDSDLGTVTKDWANPMAILQKSAESTVSRLQMLSMLETPEEPVAENSKDSLLDPPNADDCSKQKQLSAKQAFSQENSAKVTKTSLIPTLSLAKHLKRGVSCPHFEETVDFMEVLETDKEIFMEILKNPDVPSVLVQQSSNAKVTNDWANPMAILQKSAEPTASRLQMLSMLETPEEPVAENSKDSLLDPPNADDCSKQKQLSAEQAFSQENSAKVTNTSLILSLAKHLKRGVSYPHFEETVDVMEVLKTDKEIFMEILKNPDVPSVLVQQSSNAKVRLRRSGSFPAADSSHIRFVRPSTIEHKQKEVWSSRKGLKSPTGANAQRSTASKSLEDLDEKSIDLKARKSRVNSITQAPQLPSPESSQGLNKHGWHPSFIGRFKDLKKRIKHALMEIKRERNHVPADASLHSRPSGCKFSTDEKEMYEKLEITNHQDGEENLLSFHKTNGADNDLGKDQLPQIKGGSSLKESLDSYTQLSEYSFSREGQWHQYHSKSLKSSSDDKFQSSGLRSFRRRLSLPDLEPIPHIPNQFSGDALSSKMSMRTGNVETEIHNDSDSISIPEDRNQFKPPDAVEETERQRNLVERVNSVDNNECTGGPVVGDNERSGMTNELYQDKIGTESPEQSPHRNQEIGSTITAHREHEEHSVSALETQFRDDITHLIDFSMSEGSGLDPRHICADEPDSSVTKQNRSSRDCLEGTCNAVKRENAENGRTVVGTRLHYFELNRRDDADFNYVKNALELSGFLGKASLGTWYSLEQPLSPTLFRALEAYLHKELEASSDDGACDCDHLLLFDMINEQLLEIYESLLAYFPKLVSFIQHIRPLPKGNHVTEEVWKRISWYKSSKSEMDQSLEDIVVRDWAKEDGWMNLQLDVEDVALDLEDLIFDELVDEVICSYTR